MMSNNYPQSTRVGSLFASPTRAGGTYFSGTMKERIVIEPGQRLSLVKSSKVASNGSEIWSLLIDPVDENRVHETSSNQLRHDRRQQPPERDEIPF